MYTSMHTFVQSCTFFCVFFKLITYFEKCLRRHVKTTDLVALCWFCRQMEPIKRISAAMARHHDYFMDLPPKIHDLPDGQFLRVLDICLHVLANTTELIFVAVQGRCFIIKFTSLCSQCSDNDYFSTIVLDNDCLNYVGVNLLFVCFVVVFVVDTIAIL